MQNQNNGQLVGGNAANRVNGYGRLTKLEFHRFNAKNPKVKINFNSSCYDKALDCIEILKRRQWPRSNVGRYSEEFLEDFGAVCEGSNGKFKELRKHYNSRNVASTSSGSYGGSNVSTSKNKPLLALPAPKQTFNSSWKQLSKKEYKEKRANNQCFYRDQKYVPGHKCSGQMFVLEVLATPDEEGEELIREECLAKDISHVYKKKSLKFP
ncbi:hypothetical protein Tco_1094074 [Tanacetum coccineum]|uniref:Uncharacterized protein n=1 Tax=Tanacetum coccineum TaxID=301880 RepID=A0ABQ5IEI3_9ASTR